MPDDEEDEAQAALNEYRLRMAALLPTATSVPTQQIQKDLDANFDNFMDQEYADDLIGELDEEIVDNHTQIKESLLMDAVDEFIEDKKMWFRDLHKKHGDEAERDIPVLVARNAEMLRQVEIDDGENLEEVNNEIKRKMVEIAERFEKEADERDQDNPFNVQEVNEEAEWDCETILSTYTNTDNHPGVIKTTRRIKPSQKMKIELHKQFRVPVDGLIPIAEEITIAKEKK